MLIWWIVIPAVVSAAVLYGFREHGRQSRRLTGLFVPLAAASGGRITPATLLALPQLHFQHGDYSYHVGAMATGGPRVSGSASRPGFNGPFTFVNLEMPIDTGNQLRMIRNDRLDRVAGRLIDSVASRVPAETGDREFDAAFRITTSDRAYLQRVVDARLRRKIRTAAQAKLELAVDGKLVSVHIDDYVASPDTLDEMIEIASLLANNCTAA